VKSFEIKRFQALTDPVQAGAGAYLVPLEPLVIQKQLKNVCNISGRLYNGVKLFTKSQSHLIGDK
jgi:hypothetical protein